MKKMEKLNGWSCAGLCPADSVFSVRLVFSMDEIAEIQDVSWMRWAGARNIQTAIFSLVVTTRLIAKYIPRS